MNKPSRVRMNGPLVAHRRGFTAELRRQGYSPFTAVSVLQLTAHLSRWLERQGLDAGDLTAECAERYLAARRASGQVRRLTPRGLRPLLSYLRGLGVTPPPAPPTAATPRSQLLDAFTDYLRVQRGLAPGTVVGYRQYVRTFLFERPEEESLEPRRLEPAALSAFMLDQCERRSVGWLNNMATALSAFMRFLYVRGDIEQSLVGAVPRAAQRYLAPPKPVLHAADVSRLLGSCDRRRAAGRRGHALLTLLVRLGLRAAEAAALRVDDMRWRVGEIVVSGKGGTRERLPLPDDVGRALSAYCLRGRRRGRHRYLFLQTRAPYGALSASCVSGVVLRACARAGLPAIGAHRLRHSAASALRRAGVPLAQISEVLRHRHQATTVRYVHEEPEALLVVARDWPGGDA